MKQAYAKHLGTSLVLALIGAPTAFSAAPKSNIAVVDLQLAMNQETQTNQAFNDLKAKFQKKESELEKKKSELEKMGRELEAQAAKLSADELAKKRKPLEEKYMAFQRDFSQAQQELNMEQQKLSREYEQKNNFLLKEILPEGIQVILHKQAVAFSGAGVVDLTSKLVEKFNQLYKAKPAPAPKTPAPKTPAPKTPAPKTPSAPAAKP